MSELTLIMPVYNEAESIEGTIRECHKIISQKMPCKILICEDGSTDATKDILLKLQKELGIILIMSEQRKGYTKAAKDALSHAETPLVFFMDSDRQYDPNELWRGLKFFPECDLLIGKRRKINEKIHRILLTHGFNFILRLMFRIPVHDADCGFMIIKKEVIDAVNSKVDLLPFSYKSELVIRAHHQGFKIKEIELEHFKREHGGTRIFSVSKLPKIIFSQLKGVMRLKLELK